MSANVYYGQYWYEGDYIFDIPPLTINYDETSGGWWGGEFRLMSAAFSRHKVVGGLEYRKDFMIDQTNFDADPYWVYMDDRRDKYIYGVYLQDEFSLSSDWIINAGVRHDAGSSDLSQTNPRLAVIRRFGSQTTAKLLYGSAYRTPNAYEKYYVSDSGSYKPNPDLYPEEITTVEAVLEQYLSNDVRTVSSVFFYRVDGLISQTADPADGLLVFRNIDSAEAVGAEFEAEKLWDNGARLRASYTWQRAEDGTTGIQLSNSPRNLAKINLGLPLPGSTWRSGLEAQYVGKRDSANGALVEDYVVVNMTMQTRALARNLDASVGIYNLFDRMYGDPSSSEHALNSIPQNGRNYRLKFGYRF
jgi:iron complex outermembrane receptor protein